MVVLLTHRISLIHNGMDPNDSNMKDCFNHRPSPYRAVNTFHLSYKNKSVNVLSGRSCCLYREKYNMKKIQCGHMVCKC
jgi:NADPH-dependent 7-cyano-7-deazaguanine reductase QueF-like protein